MTTGQRSHRVAVGVYLFFDGKLLLLKRANPPYTFAPPGGRLHEDEDPIAGLAREVREETGLTMRTIGIADTWSGSLTPQGSLLLCINYIGLASGTRIALSSEHTDFVWASRQEIADGHIDTVDHAGIGYQRRELLHAFDLVGRLSA